MLGQKWRTIVGVTHGRAAAGLGETSSDTCDIGTRAPGCLVSLSTNPAVLLYVETDAIPPRATWSEKKISGLKEEMLCPRKYTYVVMFATKAVALKRIATCRYDRQERMRRGGDPVGSGGRTQRSAR